MEKESFLSITIWDNNATRIAKIDHNLHLALSELKLKSTVNSISEPPALARENLLDRVPVLEIAGKYWSLTPNKTISQSDCKKLLQKILET
jgi:hypothetical protein